jgi:hypothetical protein
VSFINRIYPEIVGDVLTSLTQGVSQEVHRVDYDPNARLPEVKVTLRRRPVRRVSVVKGFVESNGDKPVAYTFTTDDYELVTDTPGTDGYDTIRFLPFGKRPAPGTFLSVNYYPRNSDPVVVTDLNVGSVARTLVEAVSKELAVLYEQLNLAYDSGFVETATGRSLDRVVALLGYERFLAGRPVGTVRLGRRPGSPGEITIPPGTVITDVEDKIVYETTEMHLMRASETSIEIRVRGASDKTPPVGPGVLRVVQRAIAGVDSVTNDRPTTRAFEDESDEELRERARKALLASNKGTVGAMLNGLLQMPKVRDVKIEEMPNGVPGEIRLLVSLVEPVPAGQPLPNDVLARIEELRPAGIRVIKESTRSVALTVLIELVLAGSHLGRNEIEDVRARARAAAAGAVKRAGVGQKLRVQPLVAAILQDERVVDASVTVGVSGGAAGTRGADFQTPDGAVVSLEEGDVTFAPEAFDQPLTEGDQPVPVEVGATLVARTVGVTTAQAAQAQLRARLESYFSNLTPGAEVNAAAVLTALRDDEKYALDPLGLRVRITAQEQFVEIAQGGPSFTVRPKHVFTVTGVEVTG